MVLFDHERLTSTKAGVEYAEHVTDSKDDSMSATSSCVSATEMAGKKCK
jgi:hypothetical protein